MHLLVAISKLILFYPLNFFILGGSKIHVKNEKEYRLHENKQISYRHIGQKLRCSGSRGKGLVDCSTLPI